MLGSRAVLEAELFNGQALQPVLDDHFGRQRDHYETVTLALDLALARQTFIAR